MGARLKAFKKARRALQRGGKNMWLTLTVALLLLYASITTDKSIGEVVKDIKKLTTAKKRG